MIDGIEELDGEIGPRDRQRFVTVLRGYDRIEVDECLARIATTTTALRQELAEARQLQRDKARPVAEPAPEPAEGGFGHRAERLLRLAQQEADEMRTTATRSASALVENARAEAEQLRHEMEQQLIPRSAALDQEMASRMGELQEREQRVVEQLAATRREAEKERAAARREIEQLREHTEVELAEVRERSVQEIASAVEQAKIELDRTRELDSRARSELQRILELLVGHLGPQAGGGGTPAGAANPG